MTSEASRRYTFVCVRVQFSRKIDKTSFSLHSGAFCLYTPLSIPLATGTQGGVSSAAVYWKPLPHGVAQPA